MLTGKRKTNKQETEQKTLKDKTLEDYSACIEWCHSQSPVKMERIKSFFSQKVVVHVNKYLTPKTETVWNKLKLNSGRKKNSGEATYFISV